MRTVTFHFRTDGRAGYATCQGCDMTLKASPGLENLENVVAEHIATCTGVIYDDDALDDARAELDSLHEIQTKTYRLLLWLIDQEEKRRNP